MAMTKILQKYIIEDNDKSEYIGVGIYSDILKVKNSFSQDDYVIKIVKKDYLLKDDRNTLRTTIENLIANEHKNITGVVEYFQDKKYYYLVYQYNSGGMLMDYVINSQYYDEKMVASIVKQLLSAIIYNQSKMVYHKDLRLENLMIDDALLDVPSIKINDFGTSIEYRHQDKKARKSRKMTFWSLYFIPPEIFQKVEYNEKSDVWSIGIIMYFLMTGVIPTKGLTNKMTLNNIKSKDFGISKLVSEGKLHEDAGEMLSKLLERDLTKRLTPVEAINQPWIIKYTKAQTDKSTINEEVKSKIEEAWHFYNLQTNCMNWFGVYSLNSMFWDNLKKIAEEIKEGQFDPTEDKFTYDELYKILKSKPYLKSHITIYRGEC